MTVPPHFRAPSYLVPKVRFELTHEQLLKLPPLPIGLLGHKFIAYYIRYAKGNLLRSLGIEPVLKVMSLTCFHHTHPQFGAGSWIHMRITRHNLNSEGLV